MLAGRRKRKFERDELREFLNVKAVIDGTKYAMKNFSLGGFALISTPGSGFEIGKTYSCVITIRGQNRATIKAIVKHADGMIIGFEATENEIFARFVVNNLRIGIQKKF